MSSDLHPHHEEHNPHAAVNRHLGNFFIPFLIVLFSLALGGGGLAFLKGAMDARAFNAKKEADLLNPPPAPPAADAVNALSAAPVEVAKYEGPPLDVEVLPDPVGLVFKTTEFTAKAGQPIKVKFRNASAMMHNFVVVKPGSLESFVPLANSMMTDPKGMEKGYIPESPLIIAHTKLVLPNQEDSVEFTLPSKGEYPYVCTFPGHAVVMKGKILVE